MSCLDCNDCNQSPVYPVNIPLPGAPGSSAYVYIAFATTVALVGTPGSNATSGFLNNQPGPNSAFLAIRTVTSPVSGLPNSAFFNGYWVPLQGVTVSGINLQDDGVAVAGGPFNTVNFQGVGLTGVTVTNNGGSLATVDITTAGLIKITYAALDALRVANTLSPGASYWIIDAGDGEGSNGGVFKEECSSAYYTNPAYAHNTGIIVRATSDSTFATEAIYLARIPRTQTLASTFKKGATYSFNDPVISYGQVFRSINPAPFVATVEPADDPLNWAYQFRDDNGDYSTEPQFCLYDFASSSPYGTVLARWDNRGNVLHNTNINSTANEFIKKVFRWGLPSVYNNKINFFDDSTRRPIADFQRSPIFNVHQVNYNNVYRFFNNTIDIDLPPSTDTTSDLVTYGTRFIEVYLEGAVGEFSDNKLTNATIGNLITNTGATTSLKFVHNTIQDSVLYNLNTSLFRNNTVINNSVIGDLLYKTGINTNIYSNYTNLFEASYNTIPTLGLLNSLGSKIWSVNTGAGTVSNTGGGTSIISFGVTTYAVVGDIVFISSNGINPLLNNKYYTIVAITSPTAVEVNGTLPAGGAAAISALFHAPSVMTSFANVENNTFDQVTLRCLNKTDGSNCRFYNNTLKSAFFENYPSRLVEVPNVAINAYSFSAVNAEVGFIGPNPSYAFGYNNISYSAFIGNKMGNLFYGNKITNSLFIANAPTTTPTGAGFLGNFIDNNLDGEKGNVQFNPNGLVFNIAGVRFTANSFNLGSQFFNNTLRRDVLIRDVTLQGTAGADAGAIVASNKFTGNSYNATNTPGLGSISESSGLVSVTFARDVNTYDNVFEGRNARWENLEIIPKSKTDFKQVLFYNNLRGFTTRDFVLTGAGKAVPYNQLGPQYFASNANCIANITNVTENTPYAYTPGSITYQVATFTLTVETQLPHMMNSSWLTRTVSLLLGGFTGGFRLVGPSGTYPSGVYINPSILSISGTVDSIIDDYTFTTTITQNNNYYPLSITNNQTDQAGVTVTGVQGIPDAVNYVPANDTQGSVTFAYWYHQYQNKPYSYFSSALNPIISYNAFEPQVRIPMTPGPGLIPVTNTPLGGSRKSYVYRDYASAVPAVPLYNPTTKTINLPHFFDVMSNTVILGSATAGTYEVDFIVNMPEDVLVRFVALPGCTVQFNLQPVSPTLTNNRIIEVNNQTTLTIKSYFPTANTTTSFAVFDEVVLVRRGTFIKVDDRVIHTF